MIAQPPTPVVCKEIATVRLSDRTITVCLPVKHEGFRTLMHDAGYHWDWDRRAWRRTLGSFAGDPEDRAAEICHRILKVGFIVDAADHLIRRGADGAYEPECLTWIMSGTGPYDGWFRIWWDRRCGVNYYDAAKQVAGSQYDSSTHSIYIPPSHCFEVEDFARLNSFQWSEKAHAMLAEARREQARTLLPALADVAELTPAPFRRQYLDPKAAGPVPDDLLDIPYPAVWRTTTALYPWQQWAVDKIQPLKIGGLFMDMGTGKTRCAIELAYIRRLRYSKVIWFCPVSLKETIRGEIAKHTDCPADLIYVFDDETTIPTLPDAVWYIVGIESMSTSDRVVLTVNALIDNGSFVIVDESSYIKGHTALRTQRITSLANRARYRLILTGTPISQGVEDLYSQMAFLDTQILGYNSWYSFAANHLEFSEQYPGMVVRAHNTSWLAAKIQPYTYQVTKEECLDLPEKLYDVRRYGLSREQTAAYQEAKDEILVDDALLDSYMLFRLFNALQQIVSGFWNRRGGGRIIFPHARIEQLVSILNGLGEDKAIIWCKFLYSVQSISERLQVEYGEGSVAVLSGRLREQERNAEIKRFRGPARFLVATAATGGHGLTLTEARYAVFYENGFKYAERLQAEDRIHRIGQDQPCTYIDLVANCGIEKMIQDSLEKKANLVQEFKRQVDRVKDNAKKTETLLASI